MRPEAKPEALANSVLSSPGEKVGDDWKDRQHELGGSKLSGMAVGT